MSLPRETIVDCFWRRVATDSDRPAVTTFADNTPLAHTWQQIADDAVALAAQLEACGIAVGDRVAQLSENRYEWLIADLAILLSGAIHVPIHSPLPAETVKQQVRDSGAKVLIVSGPEQQKKVADWSAAEKLVVLSHDEWSAKGRTSGVDVASLTATKERLQELRETIQPDDPATLLYTSGTTGEPRGVLLSQRNLFLNASAVIKAFAPQVHQRRLNFLPLSHIFARTCDWYVTIVSGTELGMATSRESVFADCQTYQPLVLNGVPYFFDKARRILLEKSSEPKPNSLLHLLGGQVMLCNVGGAALPDHLFEFYEQQQVPLRQGYGLTESSPVITLSTADRFRPGSVGTAVPGVELQIASDGEILAKSPHVMLGYWQDETATRATVRDGWLHTGDLGHLDDDGFLFVTGRRKELIVLASGKKVNPTTIESLLTAEPLILQAFVVGEGRNYLTAFIVPNPDILRSLIKRHWLFVFSQKQALAHRRVREWFAQSVERALSRLAPWEQVKKFTLLGRGFTMESGEMTPKLSLRRDVIEKNLQAQIDQMYG